MADDFDPAPDRISVCRRGGTLLLRAVGRVTARHCPGMSEAGECVRNPEIEQTLVFLRDCTYFDSTFLGTILNLRRTDDPGVTRIVAVVDPSDACREILKQTRTLPLFRILAEHELPDDVAWQEIDGQSCDRDSFATHVISAHETLADIPGPLAETFRKVAEAAAADRKAKT